MVKFPIKNALKEKKVKKFVKKKALQNINRVKLDVGGNMAAYILCEDYDLFSKLVNKQLIDVNGRIGLKGENLLYNTIKNNNYYLARKLVIDHKAHCSSKYFRAIWTVAKYGPSSWKSFIDFFTRRGENACEKPKKRGRKKTTTPIQEAHANSFYDIAKYIYDITKGKCLKLDCKRDQKIKKKLVKIEDPPQYFDVVEDVSYEYEYES